MNIDPTPTDEEAAAIVAAIEMTWPRHVAAPAHDDDDRPRWRFSGRWWNQTPALNRRRPRIH